MTIGHDKTVTTGLTPRRCALVLLAAGRSTRFGAADKLAAPLLGRPLALHAVAAMAAIPFAHRFAVCAAGGTIDFGAHGFETVINPAPGRGLSGSVALGVAAARRAGAEGVAVMLADMPRVTTAQMWRLFEAAAGADTVVASSDGRSAKPPALFGGAHYDALERLDGDGGARSLILAGRHVVTDAAELVDIDTDEDITRLRALYEALSARRDL